MIFSKLRNSINFRIRSIYSKVSEYYWRIINSIFISNRRNTKHKEKLFVFAPVWGEWHIDLFFKYTMPSLMQSGNLPSLSKQNEIIFYIYTMDEDIYKLDKEMKNRNYGYKFYIHSESDFYDKGRQLMSNFLIHILKICVNENALMLLAQSDLIYSNNSVKNLVNLSEGKGVSIAVPHPRVSYECIEKHSIFDDDKEIDSDNLVSIAFKCKHHSLELCDELLDCNLTHSSGVSTRKLGANILAVTHNLPSVYLFSPIMDDVIFFSRRTEFNDIDKTWPHMLLRQTRLKVVGSSSISYIIELTRDEPGIKGEPNMKHNDQYNDIKPAFNYANSIINSWEFKE